MKKWIGTLFSPAWNFAWNEYRQMKCDAVVLLKLFCNISSDLFARTRKSESMSIQSTPLCCDKTMAIIYSFERHNRLLHSTSVRKIILIMLEQSQRRHCQPNGKLLWKSPNELNVLWNSLCHGCIHTTRTFQVFVHCVATAISCNKSVHFTANKQRAAFQTRTSCNMLH